MISVYNKISVLVIAADIVKYIEHLKIQLRDWFHGLFINLLKLSTNSPKMLSYLNVFVSVWFSKNFTKWLLKFCCDHTEAPVNLYQQISNSDIWWN